MAVVTEARHGTQYGEAPDVRPWRKCMGPLKSGEDSGDDEGATPHEAEQPQQSDEEKAVIRESAVAAAKARLKLARQKHMELTGTGKEISPEPPGHTEGVASLRADALRIAAKSRASRAAAKSHARAW